MFSYMIREKYVQYLIKNMNDEITLSIKKIQVPGLAYISLKSPTPKSDEILKRWTLKVFGLSSTEDTLAEAEKISKILSDKLYGPFTKCLQKGIRGGSEYVFDNPLISDSIDDLINQIRELISDKYNTKKDLFYIDDDQFIIVVELTDIFVPSFSVSRFPPCGQSSIWLENAYEFHSRCKELQNRLK
jgi:hypothetical protein